MSENAPEPVYKAVERILDEHSAWIARPSDEVTRKVALAATAAALRIVEDDHDRLREDKDGAYRERNQLVALLAILYPSGIRRTEISGWDPEWHGCVYIDLPTGQVSWHYHDSEAHLFAGLPPYEREWDGHTTEEKYRRIAAMAGNEDSRS